ncbi:hypothetical protein IJ707_07535 [bacterium]|nr:hypothetical protein [bacterium]
MTKTDESTLQIHAHANDYRDLCNLAGDVLKKRPVKLPEGYEVINEISYKNTTLNPSFTKIMMKLSFVIWVQKNLV